MGCPMFERRFALKRPSEYPFQSLYRPWSWLLSSFNNVALLAFLFIIAIALYKRYRKRRGSEKFTYRKVVTNKEVNENKESMISVLVIGGSGNLGRYLTEQLVDDGDYIVHSLDLFIPSEGKMVPGVSSYIRANICSPDELSVAFKETPVDVVFHTAGLIPTIKTRDSELFRVNRDGTRNVVNACKEAGVKRLIYTSTCDVVLSSDKDQVIKMADETYPYPKDPLNAYAASKAEGERIVLDANSIAIATCVIRPSIIASPYSGLCHGLLMSRGGYIGDGTSQQSLVEADACANGHILAEKRLRESREEIGGQVFQLGGVSYEWRELANYGLDDSGYTAWGHPKRSSYPKWLVKVAAFFNVLMYSLTGYCLINQFLDVASVEFITRSYTFSSDKAERMLGWPQHPPLDDVLVGIIDEYEANSKKSK